MRWVRSVGASVIAGLAAGAAGGALARVAMRIIAVIGGPLAQGQITGNGNRVGEITLGGTIALVLFGAVFSGVPGGLVYAAARPSLERFGRWRGIVFGTALLGLFGASVISFQNEDFRRFASPGPDVLLFVPPFIVFGLVIVAADRLVRPRLESGGRAAAAVALLATAFGALLLLGGIGRVSDVSGAAIVMSLLFLYLVVLVPLGRRYLPEALLFVPVLIGLGVTTYEVVRIVTV